MTDDCSFPLPVFIFGILVTLFHFVLNYLSRNCVALKFPHRDVVQMLYKIAKLYLVTVNSLLFEMIRGKLWASG